MYVVQVRVCCHQHHHLPQDDAQCYKALSALFEPQEGYTLDYNDLVLLMQPPTHTITPEEFMLKKAVYIKPHLNPTMPFAPQPHAYIFAQQIFRGDPDTRPRCKKKKKSKDDHGDKPCKGKGKEKV